jgi:multiple RNA-binding domain-containing protein 1
MSIDEPVSTTRIFVSGLPPSFTSKDLRAFIGQKFPVTDAHVFSDRRIAFVGLEDHDSAERAAKYFNRSFIRMSKISVELAKPIDLKRGRNGQAVPVSQHALREKSNTSEQTSRQQKRKRDKRDDGETFRTQQSRQPVDTIPSSETRELDPTSQPVSKEYPESLGKAKLEPHTADVPADTESSEVAPSTAPDADWLRGKTSRVLDLQEPEDERLAGGYQFSSTSEVDRVEPDDEAATDVPNGDQSIQTNGEDEHEVPNGRLFIRNLAFEATEDDLRALLIPLGSLEDVSSFPVLFNSL